MDPIELKKGRFKLKIKTDGVDINAEGEIRDSEQPEQPEQPERPERPERPEQPEQQPYRYKGDQPSGSPEKAAPGQHQDSDKQIQDTGEKAVLREAIEKMGSVSVIEKTRKSISSLAEPFSIFASVIY
jgi:hypothetical protein